MGTVDWSNRMIGIKGSRGVGKTTLILQYIKENFKPDKKVLYTSLDSLYFSENKLYELARSFHRGGGELLALDEVHRYPTWSQELKSIYDDLPDLRVIFTGSSLLHLQKSKADLSRRAVMYSMPGLSFREFLEFELKTDFPVFGLDEILQNHVEISMQIIQKVKPLAYFSEYLNYGYFPFYLENKKSYHQKLNEVIQTVLEIDIPQFELIQPSNIVYLKRLLSLISKSVPFKPNMNVLSDRTGISLNTMKLYMKHLFEAQLISLLYFTDKGIQNLGKPEKIYLDNTNLIHTLAELNHEKGNIRETFFLNQTRFKHDIRASKATDFFVDDAYSFEIGGKSKSQKQIRQLENAYVLKDDIEIGSENIIPLWLFGFLY
jgi:predicted AAA+ superfamily ATPase